MNSTYQLTLPTGLLQHVRISTPLARDKAKDDWWDQEDQLQIAMQVHSGDYFETLATQLDEISQIVVKTDEASAYLLEKIAGDLLYLQRNFIIKRKNP